MTLTPPLTPPLGTPSSVALYEKHGSDPNSQRSMNSKDSVYTGSQRGDFIRLDQLEEGGLSPFSQGSTSISFWFPRRDTQERPSRERRRDQGTAIQPGRPVNIFAWKQLGLLVNYGALGFFDGLFPLLTQALYSAHSRNRETVVDLRHLFILLRVVFALLSDTVFSGSSSRRRRGFLILGWALTLLMCAALAGASFFNASPEAIPYYDQYVPVFMLLPFGHVIAGVSADALMVEYAHREDSDERGCIQMLLLATRVVGELIGRSVVSAGSLPTTESECQGELECVLPLKITYIVAAIVAFVALLSSAFVTHIPTRSRLAMGYAITVSRFRSKLRQTWHFHQDRIYASFVVFGFLQAASFAWTSPSSKELAHDWLDMATPSRLVSDGVNRSTRMLAALLMLALWRKSNWRATTFVFVVVATLGSELPTAMLILLDKTRSQALFLATHHVAVVCEGLLSMIRLLIAVEMTMPHMEATSFAATTSVFDLGTIVGSLAAQGITSLRPAPADPEAVAWTVGVSLALYVLRLLVNIAGLRLLPGQKEELHGRRQRTSSSKQSWVSPVILTCFALLVVAACAFNVYALGTGTSGVGWTNSLLFTLL